MNTFTTKEGKAMQTVVVWVGEGAVLDCNTVARTQDTTDY